MSTASATLDRTSAETSGEGAAEAPEAPQASPGERLKAVGKQLLQVAVDRLAAAAADKVDEFSGQLEEVAANGGVGLGAAFGAGSAYMAGKSPVWGAIKGGWGALSTGKQVAIVVGLVLLGLLSPVALLIILIGLLVFAIVKATRTTG